MYTEVHATLAHAGLRVYQFITRVLCIIQTFSDRVSHGMALPPLSGCCFDAACSLLVAAVSSVSIGHPQHRDRFTSELPPNATSNYEPYFTPTHLKRQIPRARLIIMLNRLSRIRLRVLVAAGTTRELRATQTVNDAQASFRIDRTSGIPGCFLFIVYFKLLPPCWIIGNYFQLCR